jgi:hydrogenase nickel incorporation protein HypB
MCATCGCDTGAIITMHEPGHQHDHSDHHHEHSHKKVVDVEQDILHENNLLAERNRGYFDAKNILALNLVSSPGSGKTSLLEKTLTDLKGQLNFAVIEGDQQTTNDADRIHATGTKVVQINTGKGCHLDAHMVLHAVQGMKPVEDSVLFIENVGNLVCPAMFDLGEKERVVIISVTEGDDKPLKYPDMFHSSTLCIINKTDLLPYVPFDIEKVKANAKKINPALVIIELSCTSGEGLTAWYGWLKLKAAATVTLKDIY